MEQMQPIFRRSGFWGGSIRLLEIDAETDMVKVTAESGEITYIQLAEAVKFAEWVRACKDQLNQAQNRLDTEVRKARRRRLPTSFYHIFEESGM